MKEKNNIDDLLNGYIDDELSPRQQTEVKRLITNDNQIAEKLQQLCSIESRVTILGHLQRGGTPSAGDRILATKLGTACASLINKEHYGVMVADYKDETRAVPLADVIGKRKTVPLDHSWIKSARLVGTCLGD